MNTFETIKGLSTQLSDIIKKLKEINEYNVANIGSELETIQVKMDLLPVEFSTVALYRYLTQILSDSHIICDAAFRDKTNYRVYFRNSGVADLPVERVLRAVKSQGFYIYKNRRFSYSPKVVQGADLESIPVITLCDMTTLEGIKTFAAADIVDYNSYVKLFT